MSIAGNQAVIRRHFKEVVNRWNLADIVAWVAPDFVDHEAAPGRERGPASVRATVGGQRIALPDWSVTIEDIVAEGDREVTGATWRGTHRGPRRGIAPSGRLGTSTGIVIWRLAVGRLVERWAGIDCLSILRQLGALPEPERR